jgi:hypothetical protein
LHVAIQQAHGPCRGAYLIASLAVQRGGRRSVRLGAYRSAALYAVIAVALVVSLVGYLRWDERDHA